MTERDSSSADEGSAVEEPSPATAGRALAALHEAIGLLVVSSGEEREVLEALTRVVRRGCSRAEGVGVRIRCWDLEAATPGFETTPWRIESVRHDAEGELRARVEVAYPDVSSWTSGRPVRADQRTLVEGVAELLAFVFRTTRRSDLLAERLRRAESLEAIGRLAGGVAHDFNNLLTSIQGYAELLLDGFPEGDERRGDVGQILTGVERAATLTRQLLAFGRGQMLRRRLVELNRVIHDSRELLDALLRADVELELDLAPDLWPVRVDDSQVQQILVDLASNAQDAMPEGGRLTLRTANLPAGLGPLRPDAPDAGDEQVLLEVTDSGHGMDRPTRERIFEPFFTTRKLGQGRGLGLSTVYGMVEQNGGSIEVESEISQGTVFRICFPRAAGEWKEAREAPATGRGAEPVTVLVAEDDDQLRPLIRRILEQAGYRALLTAGADEAVERFEAEGGRIDLLLTDVVMPGHSGRWLVERLRRERPDLPAVYMSGYTDDEALRRGVDADEALFIPKPFSARLLLDSLRRALGEASAV